MARRVVWGSVALLVVLVLGWLVYANFRTQAWFWLYYFTEDGGVQPGATLQTVFRQEPQRVVSLLNQLKGNPNAYMGVEYRSSNPAQDAQSLAFLVYLNAYVGNSTRLVAYRRGQDVLYVITSAQGQQALAQLLGLTTVRVTFWRPG